MRGYRFGDFELDLDAFELRSSGAPVKLERRPLDLLVLLLKQSGRMVTREEIIAALWPRKIVIDFDSGVNTLARKVRNALQDSSENPKFIETLPGRGYRFIAPVVAVTETVPISNVPLDAPSPRTWRPAWIAAALSLVLAGAALAAWLAFDIQPKPTRIAVLPFENLTGDDQFAYLASGLAEDTSNSLAHIDPDNLRVVGIATGVRANSVLTTDEIGRRLGVDFLVLSSLQIDQSRIIRVSSRLLRVADNEQVWSVSLDRELTNVLGLQRELSIAIAEQIRLRLSPKVRAALDQQQTQHPKAYALYLKGRVEWRKLTPAAIRQSLEYFDQATVEDPNYSLAWAGLAFALSTSLRTVDADPATVGPHALTALQRAQQLGPNLAETQYALGYYELFRNADRRAAERAARRAIGLDPNNAEAHMLLGITLAPGKNIEALEMMRRARELDPVFTLVFANSATVALQLGDATGALEFAKQAVAMNPDFWVGYLHLGGARERLGDLEGALQAYAEAARLSDGHSTTYQRRAEVLVRLGRIEDAQALLVELTALAQRRYVPAIALAIVNTLLGDTDAAFDWLNRAVEVRDVGVASLAGNRRLRALHDDPRFDALLQQCGCLPDAQPPR